MAEPENYMLANEYLSDDKIKDETISRAVSQIFTDYVRKVDDGKTLGEQLGEERLVRAGLLITTEDGLKFNKESEFANGYKDIESWKTDSQNISQHKAVLEYNFNQDYDQVLKLLDNYKFPKDKNIELDFKDAILETLQNSFSNETNIEEAFNSAINKYGISDFELKNPPPPTVEQTQREIENSFNDMLSKGGVPTAKEVLEVFEENVDEETQSYELKISQNISIAFTKGTDQSLISAYNNLIGGLSDFIIATEKNDKLTNQQSNINGQELEILNLSPMAKSSPQARIFAEYVINNGDIPVGNYEVTEVSEDYVGNKEVTSYNFQLTAEQINASQVLTDKEKGQLLKERSNLKVEFDSSFGSPETNYTESRIDNDLDYIRRNFNADNISLFSDKDNVEARITNKEEDYEKIAKLNGHSKGAVKRELKENETFREYQQQIPVMYLKDYFAKEFNLKSDDKKADVQTSLSLYDRQIPNLATIQENQYQRAKEAVKEFNAESDFEELFAEAYLIREKLDVKAMEYANAVVSTKRKGDERHDAKQMERDYRDFAAAKNKLESEYGVNFDRAYETDFLTALQNASEMELAKRTKEDTKNREDISKVLKEIGVTLSPEPQREAEIVELVEPSRKTEKLRDKVREEGAEAIAAINFNSDDKEKELRQYRNAKERLDRNDENYLNNEVFPNNYAYEMAVKIENGELDRDSEQVQNFVQANQNLYERTQTRINYLEQQYNEHKKHDESKANVFEGLMLREEIRLSETSLASAMVIGSDRDKMREGKEYLKTIEANEGKLQKFNSSQIAQTMDGMLDEQVSVFIDGTLQNAPRYDGLAQIVKENDGVDSKSTDILDSEITALADKHFGNYTEPLGNSREGINILGGTYKGKREGYGEYAGEYAEVTLTKDINIPLGENTLLSAELKNAGIGLQVNRNYDPQFPRSEDLKFNSGLLGAFDNDSPDMAYVTFLDPNHHGSPFFTNSASANLSLNQSLNNGNNLNFSMGAETQGLFHTKSASAEYRIETGNKGRLTVGMLADHSALSGGIYTFTGPAIKFGYDKNITSTANNISFGIEGAYSNQAYIQTPGPQRIENLDYLMGKANVSINLSDIKTDVNAHGSLKIFSSPYTNYLGEESRFTNMWMAEGGGSLMIGDPVQGDVIWALHANTAYARIHNLQDRQDNRYTSFGTLNLGGGVVNIQLTDGLNAGVNANYNMVDIYGVPNGTGGVNQRFQNLGLGAELEIQKAGLKIFGKHNILLEGDMNNFQRNTVGLKMNFSNFKKYNSNVLGGF